MHISVYSHSILHVQIITLPCLLSCVMWLSFYFLLFMFISFFVHIPPPSSSSLLFCLISSMINNKWFTLLIFTFTSFHFTFCIRPSTKSYSFFYASFIFSFVFNTLLFSAFNFQYNNMKTLKIEMIFLTQKSKVGSNLHELYVTIKSEWESSLYQFSCILLHYKIKVSKANTQHSTLFTFM